jgi:hypothetical protein
MGIPVRIQPESKASKDEARRRTVEYADAAEDAGNAAIWLKANRYHSTVTLFAKLRGWSTLHPRRTAM